MAKKPVPEGGLPRFSQNLAGAHMQCRDGYVMRTDSFANLAVITIIKPVLRNGGPFQAKAFRIRPGELGAGEKTCGLQHRAVGITDGTFYTLINIGFHKNLLTAENAERTKATLHSKFEKENCIGCYISFSYLCVLRVLCGEIISSPQPVFRPNILWR